MVLEEASRQKLLAAERQIAIARAIIIVFGSASYFLLDPATNRTELGDWLLIPIYLYGAFTLFFRPYERYPVFMAAWFSYSSDCIFATLWIYATGGYYSPYHVLYYTSIIAVAYRYGIRTTLLSASIYTACYFFLLHFMDQLSTETGRVIVRTGFIYIIGYMAWLISRETLLQTQQKVQLGALIDESERSQKKLSQLNHTLKLQNELLTHAEQNARLGSYHWDLSTNKISYSSNLYRLLGHEPGDFEPSVEAYLKFIHPDDREEFRRYGEKVIRTGEIRPESIQRIITRDGRLRYLRATSRTRTDGEGKVIIGTLQDISEDVALNEELREKNTELAEINKELSSFNYVASHDLQEPLRKILTFTELVRERETGVSAGSLSYLERISGAARRMQHLIDAFLSYSQISNSQLTFEKLDLNMVMEEVKALMSEQLDQKQAQLSWQPLPEVRGVRIQLQQLFINLIGNALKYSKEAVPPRIGISVQEITGMQTEDAQLQGSGSGRYWKITVQDNGIGFEPEYNEKVFEVFLRLHSKDKYEGTGIGLAICRKVVTAHKGFIRAEGRPGEGSAFHIYLPSTT